MKKVIYYIVNVISVVVAFLFFNFAMVGILKSFGPISLVLMFSYLLLVHVLKFLRLYFIILEEKVPLGEAVRLYVKTTLVGILIPFKLGEIFKMYCVGYKIGNYRKGVAVILVEKFFDAVMILASIIFSLAIGGVSVSVGYLAVLLLVFIITMIALYCLFEPTYLYLNRFFITKSKGRKSLVSLRVLERIRIAYNDAKNMLKGRQLIVLMLSMACWALEFLFVAVVDMKLVSRVNMNGFLEYISGGFSGQRGDAFWCYTVACSLIFVVIAVITYIYKFIRVARGAKKS